MKITKIKIEKFRGFKNVEFEIGSHLTVISGQNGTQKTTLLGLLTQPFTITDKDNPMYGEKPLSGGVFKSAFSDKFKISKNYDKAGEHEWTLYFDDEDTPSYTVKSIDRDKKGTMRFWQKGTKSAGSGYIQYPVIFLSLKRLLPIGEDSALRENKSVELGLDEQEFYAEWHNKILILTREQDKIQNSTLITSTHKQTLGGNTDHYDWQVNSAGQDNIGKILLAILSFKRLKEKYKDDYRGGILAIDEADTTFYSGSQIKLLEALNKFSAKYDIQIIFTTHSLILLKEVLSLQKNPQRKGQVELIYLEKKNKEIIITKGIDFDFIQNHLNVSLVGQTVAKKKKIDVFTEDNEGAIFAKSLLGTQRTKHLNFQDKITLGCNNLIQLASVKVPSFIFPNSIIILDGDAKKQTRATNNKNILLLPTEHSPEQIISSFLHKLPDDSSVWSDIDPTFNHQYCFKDYTVQDISGNRETAKKWFKSHLQSWGRNATKVLTPWKKANKKEVDEFVANFDTLFAQYK